jgi:hypothetical protein
MHEPLGEAAKHVPSNQAAVRQALMLDVALEQCFDVLNSDITNSLSSRPINVDAKPPSMLTERS